MSNNKYTVTATGMSQISKMTFREGMSQPSAMADITCASHTLDIGDVCTVVGGYQGDTTTFIKSGYVKSIEYSRPGSMYTITVNDIMSLAQDYFIVPDDPLNPTKYTGDRLLELVAGDILSMAGITSYAYDATSPGLYPGTPDIPWELVNASAWDYIEALSRVAVYTCYADTIGPTAQFRERKPYIVPGDVASASLFTGDNGNIMSINYTISDEKLRNRVVARGVPGVQYVATASSPYLPAGYYKTILMDHHLIGTNQMAQETAERNLTTFNRLTETLSVKTVGDPTLRARDVVDVYEPFTGLNADAFVVFACTHMFTETGYEVDLTLVR